ncbi:hypothetical protein [Coprococcus comes]|uniref:hypothetical protein n=1 Tax=Coprococcus comes TaxID=410072 RepID=UPI00156E9BB6|nr:hypothetical protein [Coprococcus comes]NSD14252.1 hypothetical protein [Coprococcus comes]NSG43151.1 hypothetical protein [Coprococcus comes]
MAEMKNICGKIPVELHEKVRAEIEEKDTSTQIFIQQVIEEHFRRMENKGEDSMEKRTLAVQVTEELFQRVKWAVAKEGVKQKDFIIRIIEKAVEEVETKWKELEQEQPEELEKTCETEAAEENFEETEDEEPEEDFEETEDEEPEEDFEETEEEEPEEDFEETKDEESEEDFEENEDEESEDEPSEEGLETEEIA